MRTVITNCTVIDVRAGAALGGRSITMDEGRVLKVTATGLPADGESRIIDGTHTFAIPGLIDMHVHSEHNPEPTSASRNTAGPTLMGIRAVRNLHHAAVSGITTVRDLGGGHGATFEIKDAWQQGEFLGARPLVAGPMVTAIGGHGTEDGSTLGIEVSGVDEIRRTVRQLVAQGADVVKVVTGGVVARTELTLGELRAAVDEAHWSGVPVASHANFSLRGIRNSIAAGCDSIEHCCVADINALETMAARGTAMCPTLTVLARVRAYPGHYGGGSSPLCVAVHRAWETHLANVHLAHELGVPILAGSDAGMPGVGFSALLEEVQWLARCGLSPAHALAAATTTAAAVLRRDDLGEIASGRVADLVLLNQNPLADVRALTDRRAVVLGGEIVWSPSGDTRQLAQQSEGPAARG